MIAADRSEPGRFGAVVTRRSEEIIWLERRI
jgi:hypothetical protein